MTTIMMLSSSFNSLTIVDAKLCIQFRGPTCNQFHQLYYLPKLSSLKLKAVNLQNPKLSMKLECCANRVNNVHKCENNDWHIF